MLYSGWQAEGDMPLAIIFSITLIVLGLVFGFLGRRMMAHMRKNRALWQDSEAKEKRHAGRAHARHL